jgi:tRNA dimethylallyltransferase
VPTPIVILGPTAVGKSALALELARRRGGELVNADAFQAYRGLDIGTAKPTARERAEVPHHLVDVLDPGERWSAGAFAAAARQEVADIARRGRLPIVVGGSGLYLRALLDGIAEIPPVPSTVRETLARRLASEGLVSLRRELERLDPELAARLAPGDPQRTLRGLEVAIATGVPLTAWQRAAPRGAVATSSAPLAARRFGLTLPRAVLYDRIAVRVRRMAELGWVEEVRRLLARGVDPRCPAFQAIGYREIVEHVAGELPLETALARAITATRQLAKRQLTWFRRDPGVEWLDAATADAGLARILGAVDSGA